MRLSALFVFSVVVGAFASGIAQAQSDSTFQCSLTQPEVDTTLVQLQFFPYQPSAVLTLLGHRDLEFQWSPRYEGLLSSGAKKTLDIFGSRLCQPDSARNPFDANYSDLELIYDYFQGPINERRYDSNPLHSIGFAFGSSPASPTPPSDRDHAHLDDSSIVLEITGRITSATRTPRS